MSPDHPLKIAIIGGGLAGATLLNALLKHPHLEANIYESAPEFSERGAAVGIAKNGQEALEEIGGTVRDALDRAGAVIMSSSRMYMVRRSRSLPDSTFLERKTTIDVVGASRPALNTINAL